MHIITIIGARPQFIKAAMVSKAIAQYNAVHTKQIQERILHTGQHFDANMSAQFFEELQMPVPQWNLGCTGSVEEMTNRIIATIKNEKADAILLYGDTNSTLAGALAAESLHLPIIHVEAGLRSFNPQMREEYNRIQTDQRARLLFCPTHTAVQHLESEGTREGVYQIGDVMYDAALYYSHIAQTQSHILQQLHLGQKAFYLATIHRAETTDDIEKMRQICQAFAEIASEQRPIVFPVHPRTKKALQQTPSILEILTTNKNILTIEPVGYIDMVALESNAQLILTDSGGVQKEAYFHQTPCITMRDETEWVETIDADWNILVGTDKKRIIAATQHRFAKRPINDYGCGHAAKEIVNIIAQTF